MMIHDKHQQTVKINDFEAPSKNCPVCSAEALFDPSAWRALALDQAPQRYYVIMRCGDCGLRWLDPFPSSEGYKFMYDDNYYSSIESCDHSCDEKRVELSLYYLKIVEHFRVLGVSNRLCDIGCGRGEFLDILRKSGMASEGLDPSKYATEMAAARGHKVWHGTLDDFPAKPSSFSAAHCSHVLEHVPDAHVFLDRVRELLEPGAPLYLEVPLQFGGLLERIARLRGEKRHFTAYSIHHHYFFTPRSLTKLLQDHGFDVISLTTFLPCRRGMRPPGPRKWLLQTLLWLANKLSQSGDVISVWARRQQ